MGTAGRHLIVVDGIMEMGEQRDFLRRDKAAELVGAANSEIKEEG